MVRVVYNERKLHSLFIIQDRTSYETSCGIGLLPLVYGLCEWTFCNTSDNLCDKTSILNDIGFFNFSYLGHVHEKENNTFLCYVFVWNKVRFVPCTYKLVMFLSSNIIAMFLTSCNRQIASPFSTLQAELSLAKLQLFSLIFFSAKTKASKKHKSVTNKRYTWVIGEGNLPWKICFIISEPLLRISMLKGRLDVLSSILLNVMNR